MYNASWASLSFERNLMVDFSLSLSESGYCQFGPKCLFLHSPAETKRSKSPSQLQNTEKLYKTEPCRHFFKTGVCMFGDKCMFAHGRDERRLKTGSQENISA